MANPGAIRYTRRKPSTERTQSGLSSLTRKLFSVLYYLERPDNPDGRMLDLILADDAPLRAPPAPDLLGGVVTLSGPARPAGQKETGAEQEFTATPYYVWASRGPGEMIVCIPRRTQQ